MDQALWLLGPARRVLAHLDWLDLPEGRTDAGFVLTISHASGAHSHVSASKVNRTVSRELRVFGSLGSYVSSQSDVQAQAIFAGSRPVDDLSAWGYSVDEERWGTLQVHRCRNPTGAVYAGFVCDYYARFAAAAAGNGPQPVPAAEAVETLGGARRRARLSAEEGLNVAI